MSQKHRVAPTDLADDVPVRSLDALGDGNVEQMFAHIFNASSNAMAFTDLESGRIVDVNRTWSSTTGVPRERAIGLTALELGLWPSLEVREAALEVLRRDGRLSEYEMTLMMQGQERYVLASTERVTLPNGGQFVLWEFRDITDRKLVELQLRESQRRFRAIFDQSFQFIGLMDTDGIVIEANRSALEFAGIPIDEVIGRPFWETAWWSHSADERASAERAVRSAANGEFVRFETTHPGPDGRLHIVDFSLKPVLDDAGRVTLLIPEGRDITDLKEAEQERRALLDGMRQAQKLESLGLLAGGIAHDFNNLLTAIMGNTSLAADELPADSPIAPLLNEALTAARRAADLAQQMLAYAGRGKLSVERLRLDKIVHEMSVLLSSTLTRKATLQLELHAAAVEADATQLRQVVMNLIMNASDALSGRDGRITVRTGKRFVTAAALYSDFVQEALPDGTYAFIEIEDTGLGMSEETLARIFDPFFTTKFTGRGLGLSAVLGIVRGHHGTLHVDSAVGRGSRFLVLLPCVDDATIATDTPQELPDGQRGSGTILVVEDEDAVRTFIDRALRNAGFSVVTAVDGRDALQRIAESDGAFDGMMLDLTMPNMGGLEVLERLRHDGRATPVLLMSGFAPQEADVREARGVAGFMQKPFSAEELVTAVCAMVGAVRSTA